ncbi:MAG: triose-phosphate isomerase [Odoribacteraceae bacterium]|jgi:triosephosphate isomerase|nr:triose-phosphate isomerase [Odoribacteraceae bacterium]
MRRRIVAGNWKMNMNYKEGIALAREVNEHLRYKDHPGDVEIILGTSFIHMAKVVRDITEPNLFVAAQDCCTEKPGAHTGDVSATMIASTGAKFVIIGHSERRQTYWETASILAAKVSRALENNLGVIFCVGECSKERASNAHFSVIEKQITGGILHVPHELFSSIIIAYEPIWAIGTGKTATPAEAQEMHSYIRGVVSYNHNDKIASNIPILYGGSCSPANARELFACPDIDGGLIGGASLKADSFFEIIKAAAR